MNGITITNARSSVRRTKKEHLKQLQDFHGFPEVTDIKMLSNCVYPPLGKHILDCAFKESEEQLKQTKIIFDGEQR